jgi:cytochrome c peroxidase
VAYGSTGNLFVQTERGVLRWDGKTMLSVELTPAQMTLAQRHESGYQLFHREATPGGIACATCHPEALDDGRTWSLAEGVRRTQTLRGAAVAFAPFHWDGSLPSMSALMSEVFVTRMGGKAPEQPVLDELVTWLAEQAAPKSDAPSSAAGKALFEGRAGCSGCHFGSRLSNGALADVGTGGTFKVPSLVGVGARFPLMHSGCAATFAQRFDPACGGTAHGTVTSQQDVDDLSAYLSSL